MGRQLCLCSQFILMTPAIKTGDALLNGRSHLARIVLKPKTLHVAVPFQGWIFTPRESGVLVAVASDPGDVVEIPDWVAMIDLLDPRHGFFDVHPDPGVESGQG